jgi:acyl-CoA reductase-like NAD-dependent aldehyde dehydrogenase
MSERYQLISPVDGRIYASTSYAGEAEVRDALALARRAQQDWARTPLARRSQYCRSFVAAMLANQLEIADQLAWQMGRPVSFGPSEVKRLAERAEYMIATAEAALTPIELSDAAQHRRIEREPLGIALVVAPWNYPYLTAVNTIIPALMAGNAVILKPAGQTAMTGDQFARAFAKAGLPRGLFHSLFLTHDKAAELIISFTGSVRGGHEIEMAASGRFLPIGLELGGKDPAYVRADAPLEQTVANLVDGAFFNSGQSCCGVERIYVEAPVYDEFVARFEAETKRSQLLGSPLETATTLGPVVSRKAAVGIREQISRAVAQGARLVTGQSGASDTDDPYITATTLVGVEHSMDVMTEETFGPVAGIMRVHSDDEAIHLMNDSRYGLTASIWTADLKAGGELSRRVNAGTCFVNRCDYLDPCLAWTGIKDSGRGCSLSSLGYHSVTRPKSYYARAPA